MILFRSVRGIMFIMSGIGSLVGAAIFFFVAPIMNLTGELGSIMFYACAGLFVLFGLVFFVLGILALVKKPAIESTNTIGNVGSVSDKVGLNLRQTGRRIDANIVRIEHLTNIMVHGRAPYIVIAQAINPVNRQMQVFQSGWIFDSPIMQLQQHKIVPVFVNTTNSAEYYMDLASFGIQVSDSIMGGAKRLVNMVLIIAIVVSVIGGIIMIGVLFFVYRNVSDIFPRQQKLLEQYCPNGGCGIESYTK